MTTALTARFIGTREVAELCGTAESTVRWWAHAGRGPKRYRAPGTRRSLYRLDEVIAWVESGAIESTSQPSESA